jgi:hypothetical protein
MYTDEGQEEFVSAANTHTEGKTNTTMFLIQYYERVIAAVNVFSH